MGAGDKDNLESTLKKAARYSRRFIGVVGVPVLIGLGLSAPIVAYNMLTSGSDSKFAEFLYNIKRATLNPNTWKNILVSFSIFAGCWFGFLALRNALIKRKGRKPIKLSRYARYILFPPGVGKGEEGCQKVIDMLPECSTIHMGLGSIYFDSGRVIEAMESYHNAVKMMDREITTKLPFIGTNAFVDTTTPKLRALEERLRKEPGNSKILLEIAMRYLLLNDFGNVTKYFEMADKQQDPLAFHILASRLYSAMSQRAGTPKIRRLSFGTASVGKALDKIVYFWDRQKQGKDELKAKAEEEARLAVSSIFDAGDLEKHLESIGDYEVYRVGLNSFVKGFVAVKRKGDYASLEREKKNEEVFEQVVASGMFKSVHPVEIVERDGKYYLVLLYESGVPLAESTKQNHFSDALEFAARSDALMPLVHVADKEYNPRQHFEWRLRSSGLPDSAKSQLGENCDFLFKYSKAFPVVFDGDWHPYNCLVFEEEGSIIALDKEDKGVTIGPVTAARMLNQGTAFTEIDAVKDSIAEASYLEAYQRLAGKERRIAEPELFLPVTLTSTIEKAVTTYCFTEGKPARQGSAQVFLRNALRAGKRVRGESSIRKFYSDRDASQCAAFERVIYEHLLAPTAR